MTVYYGIFKTNSHDEVVKKVVCNKTLYGELCLIKERIKFTAVWKGHQLKRNVYAPSANQNQRRLNYANEGKRNKIMTSLVKLAVTYTLRRMS